MKSEYRLRNFDQASPAEIEDALEQAEIVYFNRCPVELPSREDLDFLRGHLPGELKTKNISYHPESDSIPKFDASPEIKQRIEAILRTHGKRVEQFLLQAVPDFVTDWSLGTTSFRPIEERGRDLKPRSSNELVHIDAGAYGATNGARILRFFVNVHPERDRVWGTKGSFKDLMTRHDELLDAARGTNNSVSLRRSLLNSTYSGMVSILSRFYPLARAIDSSPYDRSMRRIHNYMKETPSFRDDLEHYQEVHFPPMSAWMVFTDGISHSANSGQFAFVTTALIPFENCRRPELTPRRILAAASA